MSDHPLFSIVTVCLDAETHIAAAVLSVLGQTCEDYEYVVIDGGSTDGTLGVIAGLAPRFCGRLRLISEPDEGLYDAMNKGLASARGEYVEFLGADDRLRPGALEAVARAVQADPRPDIVCGATHVFGLSGAWDQPPRRVVRRGMPARVPASHQATFVRREAMLATGGFDARHPIAADYDLYLRLIEAGRTELLIEDVIAEFGLGGVSSRSPWATARAYRDVRVAHGADPVVEGFVMLKSAAAAAMFAARMRVGGRGIGAKQDVGRSG